MLRRHKKGSADLGNRVWWLNLWLLVFTFAIFLLTGALVWTALREMGSERGQTAAQGAWVLWNDSTSTKGVSREELWRPVRGFTTQAECQHYADIMLKMPPGFIPLVDKGVVYMPEYTCLPD